MKHLKVYEQFIMESKEVKFDMGKLNKFLDKFPDDAKSWKDATDELPDMYNWIMEEYNDDIEDKEKHLITIDKKLTSSPSNWNTKYKQAIINGVSKLNDWQKTKFAERFNDWLK